MFKALAAAALGALALALLVLPQSAAAQPWVYGDSQPHGGSRASPLHHARRVAEPFAGHGFGPVISFRRHVERRLALARGGLRPAYHGHHFAHHGPIRRFASMRPAWGYRHRFYGMGPYRAYERHPRGFAYADPAYEVGDDAPRYPHPGCSVRQHVSGTPFGLRKFVTVRTCLVP